MLLGLRSEKNRALMEDERIKRAKLKNNVIAGHRTKASEDEKRRQIADEESRLTEQIDKLQSENEVASMQEMERIQKLNKRALVKRNLLPLLEMLAGAGIISAASGTGIVPLIGAGVELACSSACKFNLSRKPESRVAGTTDSSSMSSWASVVRAIGNGKN